MIPLCLLLKMHQDLLERDMGEAKRKGAREQRIASARTRDKTSTLMSLGHDPNSTNMKALKAALKLFTDVLDDGVWVQRRSAIVDSLNSIPKARSLLQTDAIRVRSDEIGWYLFLAEKAIQDPLCIDTMQSQRCLPFLAAIGKRARLASEVVGLAGKLKECMWDYKLDPDGTLFELNVALAYAEAGWTVSFIPSKPGAKSPDLFAERGGMRLFVECKRQSRRSDYAELERDEFLRVWEPVPELLRTNGQWLWINAIFKLDAADVPDDFLVNLLRENLPFAGVSRTICDSAIAKVEMRYLGRERVIEHLKDFQVKMSSPAFNTLLGADWAPMNAAVTATYIAKMTYVADCEVPNLGAFVDELSWASGITRSFIGDTSTDKKARDVRNKLRDAEKQLPDFDESVVHIAVETLEGNAVEHIRQEKIRASAAAFTTEKPLVAVRVHFFQPNAASDEIFLFDETVMQFDRKANLGIPLQVVVDEDAEMRRGSHWEE